MGVKADCYRDSVRNGQDLSSLVPRVGRSRQPLRDGWTHVLQNWLCEEDGLFGLHSIDVER